jgi:hypothetical protein
VGEPYDGGEEVKGLQVHWVLCFAVEMNHKAVVIIWPSITFPSILTNNTEKINISTLA